jgi:uncharacterized membrane protein HdeD (DUF308 family)
MNEHFGSNTDMGSQSILGVARDGRGWIIGLGITMIVIGIFAIFMPILASFATTLFLGWILVIGGIVHGVHAVQHRRATGFPWALVSAILYVGAGILLIVNPVAGTATLTMVLASFFIANGFVKVVRALEHREAPSWVFLLLDGLVTLALGVLIWARWPSTALWAMGLLVGIEMLFGGSSMMILAAIGRPREVNLRA